MHYSDYAKNSELKTIIHVCQYLKYGSGKGTIQLIKALKSMGFEQKLILPEPINNLDHGNEELSELWRLGIPSKLVNSSFIREAWTAQSLGQSITQLVNDEKVAIITHGGFSAHVVRSIGFRFTHYCHGFGLDRPHWVNEQDRQGISEAYRVLVASKNIALQCVSLGIPKESVAIHYYPLVLSLQDIFKPNFDTEVHLGQVGNFVSLKGHVYSLEVLRSLLTFNTFKTKRLFLHFYGTGPTENEIKEQVREMGLTKNVLFHGHCPRASIYASIDIMLLPSLIEGLGMVNVEATEFGVPICAFNVGGVGEIIEHNKSGLLSTVRDTDSMVKNVISLIENPSFAVQLAKGAQRKIKTMFNLPGSGSLLKNSLVPAID